MVSCKQCNTHNSLDSAFCKKCGATLDSADIAIANDKLALMIADGNRLFAEGRTDDALMVADTAVACNPTSAAAISLKGMCLERKGLLAEALECFESVVVLQPDSTLDKLKVNDLKNLLVVEKFEVNRAPDRRMAVIGGMAAVMLVVACGALFARANAGQVDNSSKLVASNDQPEAKTFGDIMPKSTDSPQNQAPQQQPQNNAQTQPNSQGQPLDGNGPRINPRDQIDLPRYNSGQRSIPRPDEGIQGPIGPVKVEFPNGGLPDASAKPPTTVANSNPSKNQDEDPGILSSGGGTTTPPDTAPKNDPGIIEIEVSKGSKPTNNGGEASPNTGNGRQALIATARSQMMSGNYGGAANNYERALRAGADQASTNQRLAQCYAHMGRNGDAVAAYTRAASAFEKSGNNQGAEACRQAIKVLGG